MRLLVVNVFFDPLSFGGATIVAEALARRLHADHGYEVCAVSAAHAPGASGGAIRYATRFGFDAFAVPVDTRLDGEAAYRNPSTAAELTRIIDYFAPDIAHVHCVQDLGADALSALDRAGVPFVVTVHDSWWLCPRQFMIDTHGDFCGQEAVDPLVCERHCRIDHAQNRRRLAYLDGQIRKARRILAPSAYSAQLMRANGIPASALSVSRNGVATPRDPAFRPQASADRPIVLGFVGGPGKTKGWSLIVDALRTIDTSRVEIRAIDAAAKIGKSWRRDFELSAAGLPVQVCPPYDEASIDAVLTGLDALLMPSMCKESFGLTAREALIRGVWVIASEAGGLAEDIVDGRNGRKLPFPPTLETLRAAILEATERRTVHNHTASAAGIATFDDQARETAALFAEILAEARPCRPGKLAR